MAQVKLAGQAGRLFGGAFQLPEGYELLSVVGPAVESYYEQQDATGRHLYVRVKSAQKETSLAVVLVREAAPGESIEVPHMIYLDDRGQADPKQQGRLAVQIGSALEAHATQVRNAQSLAPTSLGDWLEPDQVKAVQFAYRHADGPCRLQLALREVPARVRVRTFAGMHLTPTAAMFTYRLRYVISGSPLDRLSLRMDTTLAPRVLVECPAMRSVKTTRLDDGTTRYVVTLRDEVTGQVDVGVNFSMPVDTSTTTLAIPSIRAEQVTEHHTIVAVQNTSRHEIEPAVRNELVDMPADEQRRWLPEGMQRSLQYVWQSWQEDWESRLTFRPAKPAARIQALIDLMAVTSVMDRQGRYACQVRLELQNRSEQFLRLRIPAGLQLWSAAVAGQAVKPVVPTDAAADELLVPLIKTSPGGLPYEVFLYVAGQVDDGLEGLQRLHLPLPEVVGVPVAQTTWTVQLPAGYHYVRPGGNMEPIAGSAERISLGVEATLSQLKRLDVAYREIAGGAIQQEAVALDNFQRLNRKVQAQMQEYEQRLGEEVSG